MQKKIQMWLNVCTLLMYGIVLALKAYGLIYESNWAKYCIACGICVVLDYDNVNFWLNWL